MHDRQRQLRGHSLTGAAEAVVGCIRGEEVGRDHVDVLAGYHPCQLLDGCNGMCRKAFGGH